MYLFIALGSMVLIEAAYIVFLQKIIGNLTLMVTTRNTPQYVLSKVALKKGVLNLGQSDAELNRKPDTLQGMDYMKEIRDMTGIGHEA